MSSEEMCSGLFSASMQGDLTETFQGGGRSGVTPGGCLEYPRGSGDQLLELSAKGCLSSPRLIKRPAPATPLASEPRASGVKRRFGLTESENLNGFLNH